MRVLTYLILIGLPTRLEDAACDLCVLLALFFCAVLRSQPAYNEHRPVSQLLGNGLIAGLTGRVVDRAGRSVFSTRRWATG